MYKQILIILLVSLMVGCDIEELTIPNEEIQEVTRQIKEERENGSPVGTEEPLHPTAEKINDKLNGIIDGLNSAADEVVNGISDSIGETVGEIELPEVPSGTSTVEVGRSIDGDTILIINADGTEERVRMLMVDTPEVHGVDTPEPYGKEASAFTKNLLEGQTVTLEYDKEKLDPYDRTLAYVYLEDGRMVNELLLAEGLASVVVYEPNNKYEKQFKKIEAEAKSKKIGIWSE